MVNANAAAVLPAPQKGAKWIACRRGDGTVTGYLEVFHAGNGRPWCSVPGASRVADAFGRIE